MRIHLRRLEPVLRRALRGPCRVAAGSRVLIAVSGGADSTALLLALASLRRELGVSLEAAHLHHGLRGAEADGDLEFMRALCGKAGVPLHTARWNTRLRMRRRGLSGENGLRTLRREYLESIAHRVGADAIATAHTADDQLETLLLRLARGTGLRGLGGMRPRAGRWIKPLLEATRLDVESDLRRLGQPWREDATNRDLDVARNRVRHEVVPSLVAAVSKRPGTLAGPRAATPTNASATGRGESVSTPSRASLARRAARLARELRDAEHVLARSARAALRGITADEDGATRVPVERLVRLAPPSRRLALGEIWRHMSPNGPGLRADHLDALEKSLFGSNSGHIVRLPGGRMAVRDGDRILIGSIGIQASTPSRGAATAVRPQPLRVPGEAHHRGVHLVGRWVMGRRTERPLWTSRPSEEYFAAEHIAGELELRTGRADEWFVPFGRRRPVRLGAFLKKQRVTVSRRLRPTVLADASGILWVVGVRRSARAAVSTDTRRILRVHAERHD